MPTFQLIYRSKATVYMGDDDLIDLLCKARRNNAEKGISGLLLYGYGNFIQLLEGPKDIVSDLYHSRISNDPRHREVVMLHAGFTTKRSFKHWSMAFKPIDLEKTKLIDGFTDPLLSRSDDHSDKDLLAPLRLLQLMQGFATVRWEKK